MARSTTENEDSPKVRINTELTGEPALWFYRWKKQGIIRSAPDAVRQAFQALHDKILERQLKTAQLRATDYAEEQ